MISQKSHPDSKKVKILSSNDMKVVKKKLVIAPVLSSTHHLSTQQTKYIFSGRGLITNSTHYYFLNPCFILDFITEKKSRRNYNHCYAELNILLRIHDLNFFNVIAL